MILESMKEELSAWIDGDEIDIHSWISAVGNFNLAVGYSSVFWPSFQEINEYIVSKHADAESIKAWEAVEGITPGQIERVVNHLHIADLHHSQCEDIALDKIIYLGEKLKEIYSVKLAWEFPNKPCIVEFYHSEQENDLIGYELTYWQAKHE